MSEGSAVLIAVGDIAFGDHPLCVGFGTHSRNRGHHPGFAFDHVREALGGGDFVFGNLECAISSAGLRVGDYDSIQMRGQPNYVTGLAHAGFNILNIANNHSLQHGEQPFNETIELLRQSGIAVCGVNDGDCRHARQVSLVRNGLCTAFLGYSLRPRQYFTQDPLYAEGFSEALLSDVREARQSADCVVVTLHWGSEFIERPSPEEVEIAHRIMDAGADLIIGHHPHVLRGIEQYGRGYIVYSLGNFVCDMVWKDNLRETAIVKFSLSKGGAQLLETVPVRINDEYQPVAMRNGQGSNILKRIQTMSRDLVAKASGAVPNDSREEYQVAADLEQHMNRSLSHRYFLRHIYRFPPAIVIQQLRTFIRNRLVERGVISRPDTTSGC